MANPKKNRLSKLTLNLASLVDRGAMEGARAVIIKAAPPPTGDQEFVPAAGSVYPENKEPQMTDAEKKVAELEKSIVEMRADQARMSTLSSLPVEQFEFYKSLDGAAQQAFLAASSSDRVTAVKAAAEADAVVWTDEETKVSYRKSDGQKTIALAKETAELRKSHREMVAKAAVMELEKRATPLAGALPSGEFGTQVAVALIGSIEKSITDEKLRAACIAAVKAGNDAVASYSKRTGVGGGPVGASSDEAKLEELTKRHAKEKGVSEALAMAAVLDTPEGSALYASIEKAKLEKRQLAH